MSSDRFNELRGNIGIWTEAHITDEAHDASEHDPVYNILMTVFTPEAPLTADKLQDVQPGTTSIGDHIIDPSTYLNDPFFEGMLLPASGSVQEFGPGSDLNHQPICALEDIYTDRPWSAPQTNVYQETLPVIMPMRQMDTNVSYPAWPDTEPQDAARASGSIAYSSVPVDTRLNAMSLYHPQGLTDYMSTPSNTRSTTTAPTTPEPKVLVRKATESSQLLGHLPDRHDKRSRSVDGRYASQRRTPEVMTLPDMPMNSDRRRARSVATPKPALRLDMDQIFLQVPTALHPPPSTASSPASVSSVRSSRSSRRTLSEMQSSPSSYKCENCDAGFDDAQDLRHHKRNHTAQEDRPQACVQCDARFLHPKDLRRHLKVHGPPSVFCTYHDCQYATKGFRRQDHLDRHLEKKHPKPNDSAVQSIDPDDSGVMYINTM